MKVLLIFIGFIFSSTALATGLEFKCKVGELMPKPENSFQFELINCEIEPSTPPACGAEKALLPVFRSYTRKGKVMLQSILQAKAKGKFVEGKLKNSCPSYQPDAPGLQSLNTLSLVTAN